jgi:hypothetical protein
MIGPLVPWLGGYFNFFGIKGTLLSQFGRKEAVHAFDEALPRSYKQIFFDSLQRDSSSLHPLRCIY